MNQPYPLTLSLIDTLEKTECAMPNANVSYLCLPANPNRKGVFLYNQSSNSAYVTLGDQSISSGPTFIVPSFQNWQMLGPVVWTGPISAIRNAGTGATLKMICWELI